jgi:hypothetical protein
LSTRREKANENRTGPISRASSPDAPNERVG